MPREETWFFDRDGIGLDQSFCVVSTGANTVDGTATSFDPDEIVTEVVRCCSTRAWPALPIATTQMTAAIPMEMPRTVKRLRNLLRSSATIAEPNRAV